MTAVLVLGAAVASGAALLDRAPDRAGAANMHNAGWPAHEITAPDDAAARP